MVRSTMILTFGLLIWSCAPGSGDRPSALHPPEVTSAVTPPATAGTHIECENISRVLGLAVVKVDVTTVVPLFAKPDSSGQPVQVIRFYHDPATNSLSYRVEGKETDSRIRPKHSKVDYDIFELSVLNRRGEWLEVVVNEDTGRTLWLQENQTVKFKDWLTVMRGSFAVESKEPKVNLLRASPADDAKEVKLTGRGCFKVEQMRGNWIEVVQQDHCEKFEGKPAKGWLKWRDEAGCNLVSIYPFA
ncbi:MAG: hypothetical protein QOD32_175 [Pyrinomonadaceae bacterium]|jgi:hypothetical protein|nr:hypothetical protein [Pyrinomonadaceae bacterium]